MDGRKNTENLMEKPQPLMRGRYCIRNPAYNALLGGLDALLSCLTVTQRRDFPVQKPRRILLCNIAHLGDVVVATSILPVLREAFPEAEVGFLAGSWAQPILSAHPGVTRVHFLDHWMLNRAALSKQEKLRRYLRTRKQALREIRAAGYDAAIDLMWNLPNTLPLLYQARIPVRIGYGSGGFGPLATHCLPLRDDRLHVTQRHLALLKVLPLGALAGVPLIPELPPPSAAAVAAAACAFQAASVQFQPHGYLVFHVGTGASLKEWSPEKWRALAKRLAGPDRIIAFTGSGARDHALIAQSMDGLSYCVNLCDHLPWSSFVAAISQARLVVCVDTVAAHVASAMGTPCQVLFCGQWPYLWRPLGPESRILMEPVPCAPCHRSSGCTGMECLRSVTVKTVSEAAQALLPARLGDGRE